MTLKTKNTFTVTEMTKKHLKEVKEIEEECGLSPWSLQNYEMELDRKDSIPLVAVGNADETSLGFIIMRLTTSEEAEIYNFGVLKGHRDKGIGRELLRQAVYRAEQKSKSRNMHIWLEVRESNSSAIKFYQGTGFLFAGYRKNFYRDPVENAVLMKLETGPARLKVISSISTNKLD